MMHFINKAMPINIDGSVLYKNLENSITYFNLLFGSMHLASSRGVYTCTHPYLHEINFRKPGALCLTCIAPHVNNNSSSSSVFIL